MKVRSDDEQIQKVLKDSFYKVPRFQRPYSWEKEDIQDFWKDVIVENDEEYFIGGLVVYKISDEYHGLVDGQQRLTTITIVLAALREELKSLGFTSIAEGIQNFIEKENIDNEKEYTIQTYSSYPYLQEVIQNFKSSSTQTVTKDEELALKEAYELIKKLLHEEIKSFKKKNKIKATEKEKILDFLKEIRSKILKLKVILTKLDNEDDAYIIFETLNTRGKDLEVSDLLKNQFTRLLTKGNKNVDLPKDKWNQVLEVLQLSKVEIDINSYIYHFWHSNIESSIKKNLFKSMKKNIKKSNAQSVLDSFHEQASYYRALYEPSYLKYTPNEKEIEQSLHALSLFNVTQPLPFLLAVLTEYKNKKIGLRQTKSVLKAIEHFHFKNNNIAKKSSSGGHSKLYSDNARLLRSAKTKDNKSKVIADVIKKLKATQIVKETFVTNFIELKYSDIYPKNKKQIQYILRMIDQHQRGSGSPINYKLMTIEHVASQSSDSLSDLNIANIGNLIFISETDNSKHLGNKDFSKKKTFLKKSYSHIDTKLLNARKWDENNISQRAKHLADIAYEKIWKL